MRRPSITRLTVAALEVALGYLRNHVASGETPEKDRAELRRAIQFLEDLVAHKRASPAKGKPSEHDHDD